MVLLESVFPVADLESEVKGGWVRRQYHDTYPLAVCNYTDATTFDKHWNDVTSSCRGLIYNTETLELVARPFQKFHNYTEVPIPNWCLDAVPLVTSKYDGSLGILYWFDRSWRVATRGSFNSDQAIRANELLSNYIDIHDFESVPKGLTILTEIIYPENQIVVHYKGREDLVFLAAIDMETGADIPFHSIVWAGNKTETWAVKDYHEAYSIATSNAFDDEEGLVLCWPRYKQPSFRLKIKNNNYIRLHRILTGCNARTIWDLLKHDQDIEQYLVDVPEEFYDWVRDTKSNIEATWQKEYQAALHYYNDTAFACCAKYGDNFSRKDFALETASHPRENNGLNYLFLDDKLDKVEAAIWEQIKPSAERPWFARGEDDS